MVLELAKEDPWETESEEDLSEDNENEDNVEDPEQDGDGPDRSQRSRTPRRRPRHYDRSMTDSEDENQDDSPGTPNSTNSSYAYYLELKKPREKNKMQAWVHLNDGTIWNKEADVCLSVEKSGSLGVVPKAEAKAKWIWV